jgi:hypothetical protein
MIQFTPYKFHFKILKNALKILQQSHYGHNLAFSWPGLDGRIRIRIDLISRIRIRAKEFLMMKNASLHLKNSTSPC